MNRVQQLQGHFNNNQRIYVLNTQLKTAFSRKTFIHKFHCLREIIRCIFVFIFILTEIDSEYRYRDPRVLFTVLGKKQSFLMV